MAEVVASAARTTTGNSGAQRSPALDESGHIALSSDLNLLVVVTAASGTSPSATFSVEWSADGTNFCAADPPDTFTAITTAVNKVKQFGIKGSLYRIVWTITGTTPSFTFSINDHGTEA